MASAVNVLAAEELAAWRGLLRVHSALVKALDAELLAAHGLTINDYEVLLFLARAEGRRLRRVDLAERVLLTASGITRLLEGLERAGYVTKEQCEGDARVAYAKLTDDGLAKLRAASVSHLGSIESIFRERYTRNELETLGELLGRLPGADSDTACGVDSAD